MNKSNSAFDALNSAPVQYPRLLVQYAAVNITFLITILICAVQQIFPFGSHTGVTTNSYALDGMPKFNT